MAYPFPLPPPPNFRVQSVEPNHVRLCWSDYPSELKATHKIKGFRLYRANTKDELGTKIADETILKTDTFQYDLTEPNSDKLYFTLVAVEDSGYGEDKFGIEPYGSPNTNGFEFTPYNTRTYGSPLMGFGEAPYGIEPYGY